MISFLKGVKLNVLPERFSSTFVVLIVTKRIISSAPGWTSIILASDNFSSATSAGCDYMKLVSGMSINCSPTRKNPEVKIFRSLRSDGKGVIGREFRKASI
jgi:hypothetical protein